MKIDDKNSLLGIELPNESEQDILEKIIKNTKDPQDFFHIVSLNPEIFLLINKNPEFKKVVAEAQIKIIDGTYVFLTAKLLGIPVRQRIHGVDLMERLISIAGERRLRIMLIGGEAEIAEKVAECQMQAYPRLEIKALQGIKDITKPTEAEESHIFSIVADMKPHFVFAAFGSPHQELWFFRHKKQFERTICMGVGGSFDYLSGNVPRAPRMLRALGFEWLYRLVRQPWRWKRQIRILNFFTLVFKERFTR